MDQGPEKGPLTTVCATPAFERAAAEARITYSPFVDRGSAGRSYTGSIRQALLGLTYINDDFTRNDMKASSEIGGGACYCR